MSAYELAHDARVKAGDVKPKGDNNSITVEGAIDPFNTKFPNVPPPPASGLPVDDPYAKRRVSKA